MTAYKAVVQKEYEYYVQAVDGWSQVQGVVKVDGLLAYTTKRYLREDEENAIKDCENWIRRQ